MESNLGWKTVELQIENLIPGIILAVEFNSMSKIVELGEVFSSLELTNFLIGIVFISVAYILGLLSNIFSRTLVDSISEIGIRGLVFKAFSHADPSKLYNYFLNTLEDDIISDDMDKENKRKIRFKNSRLWNVCYRAAVRNTSRTGEVDRRRSQGRLFRSLFFPLLIITPLVYPLGILWLPYLLIFITLFTFVYAYTEYTNFAEARDASSSKRKNISEIECHCCSQLKTVHTSVNRK